MSVVCKSMRIVFDGVGNEETIFPGAFDPYSSHQDLVTGVERCSRTSLFNDALFI